MSNVEGMYSIYFIKKRLSEAIPSFDIRHSSVLRFAFNFMKFHTRFQLPEAHIHQDCSARAASMAK
jgi:hypothetical protein